MNFKHHLILASSSPRRQFLMREAGFTFDVRKPDVEEDFPSSMPAADVPNFLASKKAAFFTPEDGQAILTADTVVIIGNEILNKPADRDEAIAMLSKLAGKTHQVITGICISSKQKTESFREQTGVTFKPLTREEIEYYVDHFHPFDKAGSYGAQDCLPAGINPCSPDEIAFLQKINKPQLVDDTFTRPASSKGIAAIDTIQGSYFNVMGLPVHLVYDRLERW